MQESRDINLYIPIEDDEDGFFGSQLVASFYIKVKNDIETGSIERILKLNEPRKPAEVLEAKLLNSFGAGGTTYEEEIAHMERQLAALEEAGQHIPILNNPDVKIIPFYIGIRSYGYIFTPSLEAPVEEAVIYFTCGGYKNHQFDNFKIFLNSYWENMEFKARALRYYCPR
ncbi:MAG: hypothetical protein LBF32_00420 [Streptococcaceae bacterium]|nr:hypothetical protein [Streptococcaceae bacterium]